MILWDIRNPGAPSRIGLPLIAQHGPVAAAAFAPDGRILATAGGGGNGDRDGTVQLWDVTDLPRSHPIGQPFPCHVATVLAVAFTAGGRILVTGGYDLATGMLNTAALWDMKPLTELRDHAADRACALAAGGLDKQEWSRYVPDLPYRKTCPG